MVTVGTHHLEKRTIKILTYVGIGTPIFMFFYGLLVALGQLSSTRFIGPAAFIAISAPWLMYGIYQFLYPPKTKLQMGINISLYHLFAALFILLVSGFSVPFISAWALLYVASYVYFSYTGFLLSIIVFFAVMVVDSILTPNNSVYFFSNLVSSIATILVGLSAMGLNRIKEYDREQIYESKKLEALQSDRIFTLINNLSDAVVSTDSSGGIKLYNASFVGLVDTNLTVTGTNIDEILKLHDTNFSSVSLTELLRSAKATTKNDSLELTLGGETMRLEITYTPVRGSYSEVSRSSDDGYVVILRDVTKAKSLEEERDEFISVVSHELRTPIAITEGAIDNARIIFDKDSSKKETVEKTLEMAHEQVIFLSKMVNDLSTLSRAERGVADDAEVIDITQLAHDLHREYAPEAEKKHLVFNLSAEGKLGSISASRLYLQELLQNFITNSIKYTKEGSVTLIITKKAGVVHFSVKDTGIGISKSDQLKIFEKFYRSEDYRTRETGGTGLGLYVSRKLSKKLGTKISVTSRLNHGSTFSFDLAEHKDS